MYIVEPGMSAVVEAQPDAQGLKVAIVVGIIRETQELVYQLFQCKNECEFKIFDMNGDDINFSGEGTQ
jgi:hypothetical protein